MDQPAQNTASAPPLSFPRMAGALVFLLLIGFAVIGIDAFRQQRMRKDLETGSETSAVRDQSWYRPPADLKAIPVPAVMFNGAQLSIVSTRRMELRETKMAAVGKDDSGNYSIYTSREPIPPQQGDAEQKGAPTYYLKTGLGEFVKVQAVSTSGGQ